MGKTLFYYRPPWIKNEEKSFYFIFNAITDESKGETLLLPNGDSIKSSDNGVIGCRNSSSSNSVDENCYKIEHNVTDKTSEITSKYKIEENEEVFFAYARKILLTTNIISSIFSLHCLVCMYHLKFQVMVNQSQNYYKEESSNIIVKKNVQTTSLTFENETFVSKVLESETQDKEDIFPLAKRFVDHKENLRYEL